MHKKADKRNPTYKTVAAPAVTLKPAPSLFDISFKVKCIILLSVGFLFYINTVTNQFALDDGIVIIQNQYVQEGFSGIKKILTTDAYDSYYRKMHASQMLAGGRYRPLSIVVFAVEHAIFGESWHVRHFVSILFYMVCILSVFWFLSKYLLKKLSFGEDMAFVAALLFAIHPMHTEVVANVKSLDEILSLLLIMCTLIFALKYTETKKKRHAIAGMFFYFLALLAKEYAALLIFLLPLAFYLLTDKKTRQVIILSLPYFGIFLIYMAIRIHAVGIPKNVPSTEILNNPYMLATHSQKIATEWFVMGKYLWMLFFPYPLSSDYSYNTIPYHNFSDISVLCSILIYVALIIWGLWLISKRNILSFPVFFYLLNLLLVSNFIFNVGATMGERLAFHSSLGFVVLLAYGAFYISRKMNLKNRRNVLAGGMAVLVVACAAECIPRNAEWKNDTTLFIHDVHVVPNSAMVLGNAGARYIGLAEKAKQSAKSTYYIRQSIQCLDKAVTLDKGYVNSYLNLGVAYYRLQKPDSAKMYWDIAKKLYPDHPKLQEYFPLLAEAYLNKGINMVNQGIRAGQSGNMTAGIQEMKKGIPFGPKDANLWYNIGGAYFTEKKYDSAKISWIKALQINPNFTYIGQDKKPASLLRLLHTIFPDETSKKNNASAR